MVHMNRSMEGEMIDDSDEVEEGEADDVVGVDERDGNERGRALPIEWSEYLTPVHIPPFSSPFGPTIEIPDTALSLFEMYFTSDILDVIVMQSNNYAHLFLGEGFCRYRPLTVEELRAYFGFCLLMAVNHLPAAEDYWKRDPVYNYSFIASRISRDTFREIGRYLHFVDNATLASRGDPERLDPSFNTSRHVFKQSILRAET